MTPPRDRRRPDSGAANTALTPNTEPLRVGAGAAAQAPAAAPVSKPTMRVPFGSYLPPDLQREYKARCVLLGIEMQDGLEEALRDWLAKNPA